MASNTLLLFLFSQLLFLQIHFSTAQNAVRSGYWFPGSDFKVSDIDSTLFTYLFCAFADLNPTTNQVTISSSNNASFAQFTKTVQIKNPSVKTLMSIGGGNADKAAYTTMATQTTSRKSFIDSSIKLARSYGFHGLDLDWEYPDTTSGMTNFGFLVNEWRTAVAAEATTSGKSVLLLTAAVYYAPSINWLCVTYPVQNMTNSLDWINLMAYDFYAPSRSNVTQSHSALYDPTGQVSGSYGVGAWIQAGMNSKKLVLGLPYYGYTYRLVDANNHGLLAPANVMVGPDDGAIGYKHIKTFISQNGAKVVYNVTIVTDYCYVGTTWIGYDDVCSISAKVSYAKQKGLLGYFAWHVANDNNWNLSNQAAQAWGA